MVNKYNSRFFTQEECTHIETVIREIETKTSGEIVVVLTPTSDSYFRIRLMGALLGWLLASAIALVIEFNSHWGSPFWKLFTIQCLGTLSGAALSYFPILARVLVPSNILVRNVHRESLARFSALGLHATKEHTGILVILSIFERRVEIVADQGINKKVDADYWKRHTSHISNGFKMGKASEHLIETLTEIGKTLAGHFPPDPANPNELSNRVRFLS